VLLIGGMVVVPICCSGRRKEQRLEGVCREVPKFGCSRWGERGMRGYMAMCQILLLLLYSVIVQGQEIEGAKSREYVWPLLRRTILPSGSM
jgi:hypothetical protein